MNTEIQKLERLIELAAILGGQDDFDEILRVVTRQAASLLNADASVIMMINPETRQTMKTIMRGGAEEESHLYQSVYMHVSGWIVKYGQSFMSADLKEDSRFTKNFFRETPIQSVLAVPLRAERTIIGTLTLLNLQGADDCSEAGLAYLERLAAIVTPYLRNVQKIKSYFETALPEAALLARYEGLGLLGKSKKFIELLHAIEAAARCEVRVLLEGQSGTGKEKVARAIHQFSARSTQPFVAVDCGAIPANLMESELFGFVKGAFTGANSNRQGLLEAADHGTLFVDEIANLPIDMQTKLLRVLQEGEVRPLGSIKTRKVDVRIISASNTSLRKLVDDGQFREDLFYRLHVYPIQIPSLEERRDDIPLLANYFLKRFSAEQHKQAESFSEEIVDFMLARQWSGNIRELENFVERLVAVAAADLPILNRDALPSDIIKELNKHNEQPSSSEAIGSLSESIAKLEDQLIRQALIANGWNQSKTARVLKLSEPTLRYKMTALGIVKPKG